MIKMLLQFVLLIIMAFVFIVTFAVIGIADWILYRFDAIKRATLAG